MYKKEDITITSYILTQMTLNALYVSHTIGNNFKDNGKLSFYL